MLNAGQRNKYWAVTGDAGLNKMRKRPEVQESRKDPEKTMWEVALLQYLLLDGRRGGLVFSLILISVGIILGY